MVTIPGRSRWNWRAASELAASLLTSCAAIAEFELPVQPVALGGARFGDSHAPVVTVEFSDFECSFCGRFSLEALPILRADYISRGLLQLAFRHLPLKGRHAFAERAATAAECAAAQGYFWQLHDLLFENSPHLDEASLMRYAARLPLGQSAFQKCMTDAASGHLPPQVLADVRAASALGIQTTPFFLVGIRQGADSVKVTTVIRGAQPIEAFRSAIEASLKSAPGDPSGRF